MSSDMSSSGETFTGRTVLWIVGAFFAVIFAANIVFVGVAIDSHSGISEDAAYDKGLTYNQRLQASEDQAALGWSLSVMAIRSDDGVARFTIAAQSGDASLAGLEVTAKLVRVVTEGHDIPLQFTEGEGESGIYVARAIVPMPGQWELRILVSQDGDSYRTTKRLVL